MTAIYPVVAASCIAMFAAWLVQYKTRNAGIVDAIWAFGMMLTGAYYAYGGAGPAWLRTILGVVTVAWFARLGVHISKRLAGEDEDGRYKAMREWLGGNSGWGFFVFFQLQALFIVVLSLPFLGVANTTKPYPLAVAVGVLVAVLAFTGEVSADRQLARFRRDPANRGRTCRIGWWKYSRHPNYFFEWVHWFAYPIMGFGGAFGYWLWLAPVVMVFFLIFVTGVPFAEQQALRSRGEDYKQYQRQTSMFVPWPPKQN